MRPLTCLHVFMYKVALGSTSSSSSSILLEEVTASPEACVRLRPLNVPPAAAHLRRLQLLHARLQKLQLVPRVLQLPRRVGQLSALLLQLLVPLLRQLALLL